MPQWDFLDFLAGSGAALPGVHLVLQTESVNLVEQDGRIRGVRVAAPEGGVEVQAGLVVGADGRHSLVRERRAGGQRPRRPSTSCGCGYGNRRPIPARAPDASIYGRMLVMLDRGNYWQCAFVIRKDGFAAMRQKRLAAFRDDLVRLAPF